jgi:membrane-associated phospholipid phosphatase
MTGVIGRKRGGARVTDQARRRVPPLLPQRARWPAAVLVACCAALIAVGAVPAAGRSRGSGPDHAVDSWIAGHLGGHYAALQAVADIGSGIGTTVLTAALVIGCLLARRVNGALLAVISAVLASVLTELVLKPLVHETIGSPPALSYPSGHTTDAFSLVAVSIVLLLAPPGGRPRPGLRLLLAVLSVLVGCAVAVSLIAIHWHYFTDTVAGAAVSVAVVLLTAFALDSHWIRIMENRLHGRRSRAHPDGDSRCLS